MKYLLKISTICLISSITITSHAYSPKLLLLEDNAGISQKYLDQNSKKKVAKDTMQVMVYEKHTNSTSDDFANGYQSAIIKTLVDCKYKAVAIGAATYYKGRTSNSERIARYDDTFAVNGITGGGENSYEALFYESIKGSNLNKKIYDFACN